MEYTTTLWSMSNTFNWFNTFFTCCSYFCALQDNSASAYIYVLGLPYITNRISINSEHDLVNVRLLSICPPEALRPHYQEGYLAGTTDITNEYDVKTELDFNNRLIAKFKITTNVNFWGDDFDRLPHNAIYPKDDIVKKICDKVKSEVDEYIMPGDIGEFLNKWSEVEQFLLDKTEKERKTNSFNEAMKIAKKKNILDENILMQIDKLRRFRNELVHQPKSTSAKSINVFLDILNDVVKMVLSTI